MDPDLETLIGRLPALTEIFRNLARKYKIEEKELLSDVHLHLAENDGKRLLGYDPTKAPFEAWLYRVVQRRCSALRKRHNRYNQGHAEFFQGLSEHRDEKDLAYQMAITHDLHSAQSRLSCDELHLFLSHDQQGYSYEEIAAHLGSKPATVRKRMQRIREKLKGFLSD
jgi:RNA polymerase sigma-70 factor (ECF subfamily)